MGRPFKELKSGQRPDGTVGLVVVEGHERALCERCIVADTPFARLKGLLGKRELAAGEGLLLYPAFAVHTWFMRFPIDAVFLDRDLRVLRVASDLKPWRAAAGRRAKAVLELAAGECRRRGIEAGNTLRVQHVG
jgi:uncharacterized membrane protein (UPF0127 family)